MHSNSMCLILFPLIGQRWWLRKSRDPMGRLLFGVRVGCAGLLPGKVPFPGEKHCLRGSRHSPAMCFPRSAFARYPNGVVVHYFCSKEVHPADT